VVLDPNLDLTLTHDELGARLWFVELIDQGRRLPVAHRMSPEYVEREWEEVRRGLR
jgi:hypothetical protein